MNNPYFQAKKIFSDRDTKNLFISLDSSLFSYHRLADAILNQPFPILLIYGVPGVGKTYLLQHSFTMLRKEVPMYLYKIPFKNIQAFLLQMHFHFLGKEPTEDLDDESLLERFLERLEPECVVIMLDEVQLYERKSLEYIRLLSDTRRFRFVLAMHRERSEEILAREYFSTRVWDMLEMKNLSRTETEKYVEKRLTHYSLHDIAGRFNKKSYNRLHRLTDGNFRQINKLIYRMFDIYEWYYNNKPSKIESREIGPKFMEMAAIDLGLIHA